MTAYPRHRSSVDRVLALLASAGMAYMALQTLVAGMKVPDYGYFLFGLLFLVLSGLALRVGVE